MGNLAYFIGTATFDASYRTGGESFTPQNAGLFDFSHVSLTPDVITSSTGLYPIWDDSADKIVVMESGAAAAALDEDAGSTDLSAFIVYIFALGTIGNNIEDIPVSS